MRGVIAAGDEPTAEVQAALDACPSMEGLDLASRVTTREPYAWGDPQAPSTSWRTTSGSSATSCACSPTTGCRVTVVPAHDACRRGAASSSRTACSSRTARAIRPRWTTRPRRSGRCARPRAPDLRDLPRPSAARAHLRRPHGEDALWPPGRESSGARTSTTGTVLITSQNHGFAVEGERVGSAWSPRSRGDPRQPQRRHGRRASAHASFRCSPCSTTPRPLRARTMRRPLFQEFLDVDRRRRADNGRKLLTRQRVNGS